MAKNHLLIVIIVFSLALAACDAPATPEPTATTAPTNTPTATLTATTAPTPEAVRQYIVNNSLIVNPELIDGEWAWRDIYGRIVLTFDENTQTLMTYSQTENGSMIVRLDANLASVIDVSGFNDLYAYQIMRDLRKKGQEVKGVKGLDIRIVAKDYVPGSSEDYVEVMLSGTGAGQKDVFTRPVLENGYLVTYFYLPPNARTREYITELQNHGVPPGFAFVSIAIRGARHAYGEAKTIPVADFLVDGENMYTAREEIGFIPITVQ